MSDDTRKAFEGWATAFGFQNLLRHRDNPETNYMVRDVTFAWHGWQAASMASEARIQKLKEALSAVQQAWAGFERHGEISHLEGQPLIYASTLEELAEAARAALEDE